ncbi:MAG: hypothetical protein ACI9TV_002350 [Sulfurimonas sp.]|jgi:hypothetical protein
MLLFTFIYQISVTDSKVNMYSLVIDFPYLSIESSSINQENYN